MTPVPLKGPAGTTALKRLMDVSVASLALVLLAPLMLLVSLLIKWQMGRPVLFRQVRPGLHGEPFEIVKFRSMLERVDAQGREIPMERRFTRLGTFLRRSSIDELPELWNVLRGDMSIVGPRPLLMEYLQYYTPEQSRRHEVRPGMTGWAQVNGRRAIDHAERIELDVWYVDHRTILLDIKIILKTLRQLARGMNAEPAAHESSVNLSWLRRTASPDGEIDSQ